MKCILLVAVDIKYFLNEELFVLVIWALSYERKQKWKELKIEAAPLKWFEKEDPEIRAPPPKIPGKYPLGCQLSDVPVGLLSVNIVLMDMTCAMFIRACSPQC